MSYVPEGGVHGFRNGSDEPASMLILFAPRAAGRHFNDEEWEELCRLHDNYFL
jgi:hypothetical protein